MSPTLAFSNGFEVQMYPPQSDHGPAHVHVWKAGAEVIVMLDEGCTVRDPSGTRMRAIDVAFARRIVLENRETLLQKWSELYDES